MWTVLKVDKKRLSSLKDDFFKKLGNEVKFYSPKLKLKKYSKSKFYLIDDYLLGDYLLCFHKEFSKSSVPLSLKYCRGLKYFLGNFKSSQREIENFISKCKDNEDDDGYIKQTFFKFNDKNKYEFISGPFTNLIFNILEEKKFYIKALVGKYKLSVSKEENLFRPI